METGRDAVSLEAYPRNKLGKPTIKLLLAERLVSYGKTTISWEARKLGSAISSRR